MFSSGIYTSFQDHHSPKGTLCSWRHTRYHYVWQWTSFQRRRNSGSFPVTLTSFTPHHHPISISQNGFHWGNGEESQKMPTRKTDGSPNAQARALLQLHDTPITADLLSPAEILHGHPAQGRVLSRPSKRINICQIRQRLVELQEKQKRTLWQSP